jgi:ubiquinol-cytochrome c reductase cytochrome b/c1 subunit
VVAAFIGYVLPWGQMSYWAATVIINFFTVVPMIGYLIALIIWGAHNVSKATLNRFFILHVISPVVVSGISILHLYYLHQNGSSNGMSNGNIKEPICLGYYFKVKEVVFYCIILISFCELRLYSFNLGHSANYILASPLVTPELIVPEWYFLSFYAILRGIPNKLFGIISFISLIINNLKALLNTTYD